MGKKLYVGNLPFSATPESLKEEFLKFGAVESVTIIMDNETGLSKGFGFVEMGTQQEGASAIAKMNGSDMDGRALKVSEAKPMVARDAGGPRRSKYDH